MKKGLALFLCCVCVLTAFTGCKTTNTGKKPTKKPTATATINSSISPDVSSSADLVTTVPSIDPEVTPSATAKPTPKPTPIRPAQTTSIVPAEVLSVGYNKPLSKESVSFPKNYKMPYYIEVDVTNQCINVFIKNTSTGEYDILLNRFIISGGTSTKPTKLGNFYIKSDAEQKKATGQNVKYYNYFFKNYGSYAYYVTRYSNAYMFHSFTFSALGTAKTGAYYNMGNPGSAGCLRMLMNHAKWIYDNIDAGTYCVVNKKRPYDATLSKTLKKYIPPLGWDMTTEYVPGDSSKGLVRNPIVTNPDNSKFNAGIPTPTPTATPELTPTPIITPTPMETPIVTQKPTPTPTPTPTAEPTPEGEGNNE